MAQLEWDKVGERLYQTGDKNVALYVYQKEATIPEGGFAETHYPLGVAWNGVTSVTETPGGADANDLWADDDKYATMRAIETFSGSLEAYMYPDEWEQCDGSATVNGVTLGQQTRKAFGLAYVTTVGNDTELNEYGEKLHMIYGCTASPSDRSYSTINESPDAITFNWDYETTPIAVGTVNGVAYKKVSCLTIDSHNVSADKYQAMKTILFGGPTTTPHLPEPKDILAFFGGADIYTYTAVNTEPSDWDTAYVNYFTRTGTTGHYVYTAVPYSASGAPEFTTGTYYSRSVSE